jgi:hypothetical protein
LKAFEKDSTKPPPLDSNLKPLTVIKPPTLADTILTCKSWSIKYLNSDQLLQLGIDCGCTDRSCATCNSRCRFACTVR